MVVTTAAASPFLFLSRLPVVESIIVVLIRRVVVLLNAECMHPESRNWGRNATVWCFEDEGMEMVRGANANHVTVCV
jgi:hypothetical protein